ncbi:hypothetical protein M2272_005896 [Mycobacterium frederiksbergense]|uniref:Uncharacterized protein n=1 Tax=Mycolicibacterium frederiksbergense TaxID=117567 RepID=A0ABT6L8E6_9MYCO|nr:hypothetical protein [Mycolicibacterium frederiksbergense]
MTAAKVLLEHQGPYFNGVDLRCKCGQVVVDGADWARHTVEELAGVRRRIYGSIWRTR